MSNLLAFVILGRLGPSTAYSSCFAEHGWWVQNAVCPGDRYKTTHGIGSKCRSPPMYSHSNSWYCPEGFSEDACCAQCADDPKCAQFTHYCEDPLGVCEVTGKCPCKCILSSIHTDYIEDNDKLADYTCGQKVAPSPLPLQRPTSTSASLPTRAPTPSPTTPDIAGADFTLTPTNQSEVSKAVGLSTLVV